MAGKNMKINGEVDLKVNFNSKAVTEQLGNLQKSLTQVSNISLNVGQSAFVDEIREASSAALELQSHLINATNINTGNLDFSKLNESLRHSNTSLEDYASSLAKLGPQGKNAFLQLANSISNSEIPLKKANKLLDTTWENLKKTIGWQFSSSLVHGFIGSIQQAVGYAQDLNKSLTDIRIVTGQSSDQMATFARQANEAAKNLSTTTTDYTKASLIYYQQGLSDQEVKARTETTIKMANATRTSAQKVSDQMTAIWNNYDDGTKSLTHYADVMTALGAATASSTDEIAQGLQKFASISDTVGLSYEYAASALATITSTSRESADVVGNSLKTLFSRIQGLQLGETLDDGTTLNKYSSALASVGISIKDASGEMKDMDNILDEMGAKWQTLARDEQMALAQTVAGVRQYTQLMTLMENWDVFKSNLNIANTSAGTLDQQAAIYAESWEAASNRVRASWEGLWDTCINSDSFIGALDMITSIVDGMDNFIQSIGGGGSALAALGGILTKVFTPQIASTVSDIGYGIKMMMPGAYQKEIEKRGAFVKSMADVVGSGDAFGVGLRESQVIKDNLISQMNNSILSAERRSKMTPQEIIADQLLDQNLQTLRQKKQQNAAKIDKASNQLLDTRSDQNIKNALNQDYSLDAQRAEYQKQIDEIKKQQSHSKHNVPEADRKALQARRQNLQAQRDAIPQNISLEDAIDQSIIQGLSFVEQFDKSLWDNTESALNKTTINHEDLAAQIKMLASGKNLDGTDNEDFGLIGSLIDMEALDKELANAKELLDKGKVDDYRKFMRKSMDKIGETALENVLNSIQNETTREKVRQDYAQWQKQILAGEREGGVLESNISDAEKKKKELGNSKNIAEGLVEAADGIMFTVTALQSFKALGESLQSGDIAGSLMSFANGLSSSLVSVSSFASAFKDFGVASSGAASALGV